MPFEDGNQLSKLANHKKPRLWSEAINRAIKRREEKDPQALEKLADKLLEKVDAGDVSAIRELGDRLQGKSPIAIEGTGADGGLVIQIVRQDATDNPPSE